MVGNNDINIRSDLTDISNTIMHLYELSKYFEKMRREFGSLWYDNDSDLQVYLSKIDDWELFHLMEEFYRIGKDASYSFSLELPLINNEKRYPVISRYIDMIEKSVASYKKEIIELLTESEKIFLKKEEKLGHWKIDRLVEIHKEMLSNLNALKNEFKSIKNSERYRIENNLKVAKLEPKEIYEIEGNNKKSKIFLSYCHKDKKIADRVDGFFISKNIRLTRDERDVLPYSDLKKFMDTIRDHDYVILLISDAYLKSTNCMYEVIQFIQERNYIDRTFPIVIDNEATIFDNSKHGKYLRYWQNKYKKLGDEIKALQCTGTSPLHKELDKIDKIQSNIGEFLSKIVGLNCFPLDKLESTNYKTILDKIGETFVVPQKEEVEIKSDKLKLRTDDKRATNSATKTITLTEPVPLGTPLTKDGITVTIQRIEVVEPPLCVEPFGVEIYFSVINNSERVLKSGLLGPATGSLFYVLDEEIYEDEFNAIGYNHIGDAISWVYPGQSRSIGYRKCFHSPVTIKQITWTGTFADDQTEIELGLWEN